MRKLITAARVAKVLVRHPGMTRAVVGLALGGRRQAGGQQVWERLTKGPDVRAEKIVSRRYRYVWLCVPKVASRSLVDGLKAVDPEAELIHGTIAEVYAAHPEAREYHSFAFIRHPFRRTLSFYSELFPYAPQYFARSYDADWPRRHVKEVKLRRMLADFPGLAATKSFEDYCHWLHTPYGSDTFGDRHFLSQHLQIRLEDGRLPDFVGRHETLDEDLARVSATLGMPTPSLRTLNTMVESEGGPDRLPPAHAAREAYLTRRCRTLLRARYREDLRLFGYSPE